MKNIGIIIIAIIAGFIVIGNIGPILVLGITVGALYFVFKQYVKADKNGKFIWGALGLIILIAAISNLSAFVGLAAMVLLYYLYKNYQEDKTEKVNRDDPFKKFEREWEELSKK
ncbi:flagellar basal body rod protein [Pradoshia eiseniae]|uniref:Flagellar basal body rod protein n=1 Tax=Pradoshia eiseniae TaxID=2064768 RepID=A0A2S7MZA7_9BACI|nr:flagellar basal body rod protein [Pradoshia eiseniae]PQD95075.1 flagellar basal body rod protein [Pradoshia eiseniae]